MLSTCCQTNEGNAVNVSEDFPSFSRIEPLHHLLDAFVVNDEEETLLSSILHYRRKNISLLVLFPIGIVLVEELADSRLCGFALAFDRHVKSFESNFNAYSPS